MDYFLARYYSSVQGRFTSTDEFKGDPAELFVLGSGDPEKQALVYADVTNPQSLNKYQYTFNNPLRYVDPDGKSPQERLEIQIRNEEKAFGQGKLSRQEIVARAKARGVGAIAGLLILASARSPVVAIALWRWAMRNPDKVHQIGQAMTEVAGGPPTLTQLPGSRLRAG